MRYNLANSQEWKRFLVAFRYEGVIAGLFYGHAHQDLFEIFFDPEDSSRATKVGFLAQSQTTYNNMNPGYKVYSIDGGRENATYVSQVYDCHAIAHMFKFHIFIVHFMLFYLTLHYVLWGTYQQMSFMVLAFPIIRWVYLWNWYSINGACVLDCTGSRELVLWPGRCQHQHGSKLPDTVHGKGGVWVGSNI